jgi:hypothetical protein
MQQALGKHVLLKDGVLLLAGLACCLVGWLTCKHLTAAAAAGMRIVHMKIQTRNTNRRKAVKIMKTTAAAAVAAEARGC